ncbi:RGCVC family protein [Actinomycetospora rhizophila]|uniref:RGCVC family protein n=1 Tax=Actinomycetospora rhizophila TaxID=1416876 RepID=A0ABV9ZFC6_9PSEU
MSGISDPGPLSGRHGRTDDATCTVCPHPWPDHDALGRRFCTATQVSALSRGCICSAPTRVAR